MTHHAGRSGLVISVALLLAALAGSSSAEIPQMISYQGRVTDDTGVPVADGTYDMRFRIYDAETAGNLEWDSGTRSVNVEGGVFNVFLGESPQPTLNLPFDEDYWLLVTFDGVDQTPRQRFASAGYAYMASGLVPGTEVEGSPPVPFSKPPTTEPRVQAMASGAMPTQPPGGASTAVPLPPPAPPPGSTG